ncbi:MAG: hypothetical protein K2Q10_05550 [Rhodospirillales bacterium]|nr:hypothetical protein [Rhodospirillales bacterium]
MDIARIGGAPPSAVRASEATASTTAQTLPHSSAAVDQQDELDTPLYASPIITFDKDSGMALLRFRDVDTGEVTAQYPPERAVREYRQRGASSEERSAAQAVAAVPSSDPSQGGLIKPATPGAGLGPTNTMAIAAQAPGPAMVAGTGDSEAADGKA